MSIAKHVFVASAMLLLVPHAILAQRPNRSAPRESTNAFHLVPISGQSGCGLELALRLAVRDSATWNWLWARSQRCESQPSPAPPIDFNHEMVLVAAWGDRPSTGFGIAIDSAYVRGANLHVIVTLLSQACDCIGAGAAIARPTAMVRTANPRWPIAISFSDREDAVTWCMAGPRASTARGKAIVERSCRR